jgi:competence protein ComEC
LRWRFGVLFFIFGEGMDLNLFQKPVVAATLCWVVGLALAGMWPWAGATAAGGLAVAIGIVLWVMKVSGRTWGCCLLLIVVAMGYYHWTDARNVTRLPPDGLAMEEADPSIVRLKGVIRSEVEVDGDHVGFTFRADKDSRISSSETVQVSLRVLTQEELASARSWRRGDRIEIKQGTLTLPAVATNFGGFNYREYLRLKRIHRLVSVKGTDNVDVIGRQGFGVTTVLRANDSLRRAAGHVLERIFPAGQAGYMEGLLIGLQDEVDPLSYRQFSQLGLSHILAISGLHVAIFVSCCLWLLRRLGRPKETNLLIVMCLLPLYTLFTGASPSALRAGAMGMIALYAERRGWLKDGLHLVCLVGMALLLIDPYYLYNVSFQLSFLVTLGLILFVPRVSRLLPIRSRMLNSLLSIGIVSQAISFPLSIYYFNQFSLLSLPANLIVVPAVSALVIPIGSLALIVGAFSTAAGGWAAWPAAGLNKLVFWIVAKMNNWHAFQTIWPSPSLGWILAYYLAVTWLCWALIRRSHSDGQGKGQGEGGGEGVAGLGLPVTLRPAAQKRPWVVWCAAAGLAVLLWYGYQPDRWLTQGSVHVLDVGQGDAILVRTPSGKHILVDGGGTLTFRKPGEEWKERRDPYEVGRKLLVPLLKKRGVQQLDYVILTHDDADHYGGLQAVAEQIPIGRFLFNGEVKASDEVFMLFGTLLERGVPMQAAVAGMKLDVDKRTRLDILYPRPENHEQLMFANKQNNDSVVSLLTMEGVHFLLTGDMENLSEQSILLQGAVGMGEEDEMGGLEAGRLETGVDVLKVAHHGSKTSTSQAWLDYWRPKMAVISVGAKNVYGHPNEQVISRLEASGIDIFRTDRMGEVVFETGGGALEARTVFGNEKGR